MFPTLLLLNHSCEPNTQRINTNGNQVLMVAKRRINKGEEVTDNYGIHHLRYRYHREWGRAKRRRLRERERESKGKKCMRK